MSKEISKTYEVSKEEITNELKAAKAEEKKREQEKVKKSKVRTYVVLLFILCAVIIAYIAFRGEYLEILEIGENYIEIFWNKFCCFILYYIYEQSPH